MTQLGGNVRLLARLRRFYWRRIRSYAYEVCQDCGRPVSKRAFGLFCDTVNGRPDLAPRTFWFADNHVWNAVMGCHVGVLCPSCFMARIDEKGLSVGWRCGIVGEIEP